MKRYFEYIDNVNVPDTLHQRLLHLEEPRKHTPAWKKYGAAAAALALVAGVGGYGAWAAHINSLDSPLPPYPAGYQENRPEMAQPDIAPAEPGDVAEPGMKTIGGYEVQQGEVVSYFMLPYIEYGRTDGGVTGKISLDWALGEGFTEGPVSQEEIEALLGGEDVLSDHLDWGGYELFGWRYDRADGTPGLIMISGHKGELDHFVFSLMYGELPPTCIAYPESVDQEIWGVTVTADKYDGPVGSTRRVSFLKDGWGYCFDLTSTDTEQAEQLVSRLTRWIIVEGLALDAITSDGAAPAHPWEAGVSDSVGEPNWNDGADDFDADCPYCVDGTPHTHTHLPKEALDPSYGAAKGPDDPGAGGLSDGDPIAYKPQANLPS